MIEASEFKAGDPVTLTFDDGSGVVRTWHGEWAGLCPVVTLFDDPADPNSRYLHEWYGTNATPEGARMWVQIRAPYESRFDPQGLESTIDRTLAGHRLGFVADTPGLTVTPVTEEGAKWIASREPYRYRRDRLIARVRELDPAIASELDDVIDALISEARYSN